MILRKKFFKLINNAVFGKTMGNVRKHRDVKLVTTERRRYIVSDIYLVSEPNYHTTKYFTENLLAIWKKSGSAKINYLFNLISQPPDIDKTYLYAKDQYEAKNNF